MIFLGRGFMSLRLQTFFGILVALTLVLNFGSTVSTAQSNCESCKESVSSKCANNCKRFSDPKQVADCVVACQNNNCVRPCTHDTSQASEAELRDQSFDTELAQKDMIACERCLKTQRRGYCRDTCRKMNPNSLSGCMDRCAKQQCQTACVLPTAPIRDVPKGPRMDCSTCRQVMEFRCTEECGNSDDKAGTTSCQVSCVEDACLEACNPELFE